MELKEESVEEILSPRQLEFYLLEQEGLGSRQIAEKLGLSRGMIVDTLKRAHQKLRLAGLEE